MSFRTADINKTLFCVTYYVYLLHLLYCLLSYLHRNYRNYSVLYQHFKTFIYQLLLSSNELVCTFKVVSVSIEFLIFKYSHLIKNNLRKANEIMLIMSIKVKRRDLVQISFFFINLFHSVSCINASITN